MELRRELLNPKPTPTKIIGQECGHWLKDKALVSPPKKFTKQAKRSQEYSPPVLVKDFGLDKNHKNWHSSTYGDRKIQRAVSGISPRAMGADTLEGEESPEEALQSLLVVNKKALQRVSPSLALHKWKKTQHDSIMEEAHQASIIISARRYSGQRMSAYPASPIMEFSVPNRETYQDEEEPRASSMLQSERRPLTPNEYHHPSGLPTPHTKVLEHEDSADQLLDSKLIESPYNTLRESSQKIHIKREVTSPTSEIEPKSPAGSKKKGGMSPHSRSSQQVFIKSSQQSGKRRDPEAIEQLLPQDVALSRNQMVSEVRSISPRPELQSTTPEPTPYQYSPIYRERKNKSSGVIIRDSSRRTQGVGGFHSKRSSEITAIGRKWSQASRSPHQISINALAGMESVQITNITSPREEQIKLPRLSEIGTTMNHTNRTLQNAQDTTSTMKRTLVLNPLALFPKRSESLILPPSPTKNRIMPPNLVYTKYERGLQRKLQNKNYKKRDDLINETISAYRSPEQWLKDYSNLSFSPSSYQPNKVEKTIRQRIQDFEQRAQNQDIIKTVRSHVSTKDVVDRLYYHHKSQTEEASLLYRHLSYTPKHSLHISVKDVQQVKKESELRGDRAGSQQAVFTMTTSTMNLESLVSFDKESPGMFQRTQQTTKSPTPKQTRVQFFPEITQRRASYRYSRQMTFSPSAISSSRRKSSRGLVKDRVKYKSAMDYLKRNRPSMSKGNQHKGEDFIDFDEDLWKKEVPRKFPYLRSSQISTMEDKSLFKVAEEF